VAMWVDADKQLQEKELLLASTKSRLETLTYILDTLKYRTQTIGNLIKYEMWKSGE